MYTLHKTCICTCACANMQQCRKFFATRAIANLFSVLPGHREAGVCHSLLLSILLSRPNPSPDTVHSRNLCDERGTHLAEGAAKDTNTTVFLPPLVFATVRSLGLFSTIAKGRISLVADVECLSLCTQWRCQEKNNPSDAPHGSAQGKTGRIRAYLWELTDGGQATE